ncbi:sensor domain-containing diguanylate cyclase [Acidocella sp.]|uniref:GGDEF domain-containing protein n=1 Tax=Acidocella sp. TaxID=50710 RepID=UPI0018513561|nr:sensor domain-containing diguanylate cyclase [Acidocella sp.]NNM57825.1 sensor domain-containing diguanylate cyclase [Acidocella sp.]
MNEILALRRPGAANAPFSAPVLDDDESIRLQALDAYEILDSEREKSYDDIARLAAFICGTPVALISFFDRDRQWVKARFSSSTFAQTTPNLPRSQAFCDLTIAQPEPVIIVADILQDPRFAGAANIIAPAKLRFYAAVPLVAPTGAVLGSLSVLDRRSRTISPEQTSALQTLARQIMELLDMRRTVIGLSAANARLGQQSITDALTGIPNRRAYDQKLNEEVSRARRTGSPLSLLMVDIDMFKQYNDTFGHMAGDTALQSVARVLLTSLRPYDFLARYGGEEFAIILPATDLSDAILVAERVRALVSNSEFPHRKFTISIGVARLDLEAGLKAMVQTADNGLYRAKASGRNKVVVGNLEKILAAE